MNGMKKSAKNRESQWYAQSEHCAHTVTLRGNVGSLDALRASQLFIFGPKGLCNAFRGS